MTLKRGLTHQEAMEYVGVKRRTFDEVWRPQLVAMRQGACVIFGRADLDRLFDQFKQQAAGQPMAANDAAAPGQQAHNGARNSALRTAIVEIREALDGLSQYQTSEE